MSFIIGAILTIGALALGGIAGYAARKYFARNQANSIEAIAEKKLAEVKGLVGEIGKQLNPDTPVGSLINKGVV